MKSLLAVVLGVVLVATFRASTEAAPADADEQHSVAETEEGETTTVTAPSNPIDSLPDDVLRQVFSLVATADEPEAKLNLAALLDPASQVCRRWRRLTQDPAFWDHVDLVLGFAPTADDEEVDDEDDDVRVSRQDARVLLGAPALRSLHVEGHFSLDDAEEAARFLNPALAQTKAFVREKLCVEPMAWESLGEDGRGALLALLRRSAPFLRKLEMFGLDNPDGSVAVAADEQGGSALNVLAGLQSLEELSLLDLNPSLAYNRELANVVLPNLQSLRITESHSVANSPKDFYSDLVQAAAPTLSSLRLEFEPSTSEALQRAVQNCKQLQSVIAVYPGPFPALGECPEIKELTVAFRNMKAEQVGEILQECEKIDKLEKLELVTWGEIGAASFEDWNSAKELAEGFAQQRPQTRVIFG